MIYPCRVSVWLYDPEDGAQDRWAVASNIWLGNEWQGAKEFPHYGEAIDYANDLARKAGAE